MRLPISWVNRPILLRNDLLHTSFYFDRWMDGGISIVFLTLHPTKGRGVGRTFAPVGRMDEGFHFLPLKI